MVATKRRRQAVAEPAHDLFLLVRRQLAVDQPDLVRTQALPPFFECLGGGLRLERFAFLDQRIDKIGLATRRELFLHERGDVRLFRADPHAGDDFPPAGRFLVEQGDVQIAVDRHRQCPRNRRGGHHQHIGHHPEADERSPLGDAELVLLVDDHQPEVAEKARRHTSSAWVPMIICGSPSSSRWLDSSRLPVRRAMRTPSGSSQRRKVR